LGDIFAEATAYCKLKIFFIEFFYWGKFIFLLVTFFCYFCEKIKLVYRPLHVSGNIQLKMSYFCIP